MHLPPDFAGGSIHRLAKSVSWERMHLAVGDGRRPPRMKPWPHEPRYWVQKAAMVTYASDVSEP